MVACLAFLGFRKSGESVIYLIELGKQRLVFCVGKASIDSRGVVGMDSTATSSWHVSPREINGFCVKFPASLVHLLLNALLLPKKISLLLFGLETCLVNGVLLQVCTATFLVFITTLCKVAALNLATISVILRFRFYNLAVLSKMHTASLYA